MEFKDTFIHKHYLLVKQENILFTKWCKKLKISYMDMHILTSIASNNGVSEPSILSEELLIPKQTITSILDKLEKNQFIERIHSTTDRRKITVKLLDKGEKMVNSALNDFINAENNVLKEINKQKLDDLISTYENVISILKKSLL